MQVAQRRPLAPSVARPLALAQRRPLATEPCATMDVTSRLHVAMRSGAWFLVRTYRKLETDEAREPACGAHVFVGYSVADEDISAACVPPRFICTRPMWRVVSLRAASVARQREVAQRRLQAASCARLSEPCVALPAALRVITHEAEKCRLRTATKLVTKPDVHRGSSVVAGGARRMADPRKATMLTDNKGPMF